MDNPSTDEAAVITLPLVLDLGGAQILRETLLHAGSAAGRMMVDAAQVERIGTPAIQVLLAAARAQAANDRPFTLRQPSEVVVKAFEDLGLIEEMNRWSDQ